MSRRFQFSLRAMLVAVLVVAIAVLPLAWLVKTCRAWLFDEPVLALTFPPRQTVTIEVDLPPIEFPAPEDKMPVTPFGREPEEPFEL